MAKLAGASNDNLTFTHRDEPEPVVGGALKLGDVVALGPALEALKEAGALALAVVALEHILNYTDN